MTDQNPPKRILITNIVSLNPGDAAILWGTLEILKQRYGSNTRVVVFDRSAEAAGKYYPWASFRQSLFTRKPGGWFARRLEAWGYGHWNLRLRYLLLRFAVLLFRIGGGQIARLFLKPDDFESLSEYSRADLVLSSGGTYLTENYGLWSPIYDYRLTLAAGAPLVFFTQTLGPFRQPKHRRAFSKIFERAEGIFLRDERSRDHVIELGIKPDRITLGKDAAFMIRATPVAPPSGPLKIAISVRTLKFFSGKTDQQGDRYIAAVTAMVNLAVRKYGAEIEFLSTCQGIPEYWTDDTRLAKTIVSALPADVARSVTVDSRFRQPTEIVSAYQGFHLVIATRMHAAILSLVAGTPVLGVAYEFKLEELFHQLGMDEARLSTKEMNTGDSEAALTQMLENLELWREKVQAVQADCRRQATSVMDKLPDV